MTYPSCNLTSLDDAKIIKKALDKISRGYEENKRSEIKSISVVEKLIKISQISLFLSIGHQRVSLLNQKLKAVLEQLTSLKRENESLHHSLSFLEKLINLLHNKEFSKVRPM